MSDELSPDMIWYTCLDCGRNFTLADSENGNCAHCGSSKVKYYE